MTEQIDSFLVQLRSNSLDLNVINNILEDMLESDDSSLRSYMNYELFMGTKGLLNYLQIFVKDDSHEDSRRILYSFIAEYLEMHGRMLTGQLKTIFKQVLDLFRKEERAKAKEKSLEPLKAIIEHFSQVVLFREEVCNPGEVHADFMTMLKTCGKRLGHTVKGQCWHLLGLIQEKFPSRITSKAKEEVQKECLALLKSYVKSDSNLKAIALILRSFRSSLRENYLSPDETNELYAYTTVLAVPLKTVFEVPIAALQLLQTRCEIFNTMILKGAQKLFKQLCGLIAHKNKNLKFQARDTLAVVSQSLLRGISSGLPQTEKLFTQLLDKLWTMLKDQSGQSGQRVLEPVKQQGSGMTIVHILSIFSPLILEVCKMEQYKKFFKAILTRCSDKVLKDTLRAGWESNEGTENNEGQRHKQELLRTILYKQKELSCFLGSLGTIVEQLDRLEEEEAEQLQRMFVVAVEQYPMFLAKYVPQLIESLVHLIMGLHNKSSVFGLWGKKVAAQAFRQSVNSDKVVNDKDYYQMVSRAGSFWTLLLGQQGWFRKPLEDFAGIFFETISHYILTLNCSYRTRQVQEQLRNYEEPPVQDEIVNVFYLASETIQVQQKTDFQLLTSIALVFSEVLQHVDPILFLQHVAELTEALLDRLRIFPKSLPLMKILRSLNNFITRHNWFLSPSFVPLGKNLQQNFIETNSCLFKYQEQYLYEALKMLLSTPVCVFLLQDCRILKECLPNLIIKSLELGQDIFTLAYAAFRCLSSLFEQHRSLAEEHIGEVIPHLQKFISASDKPASEMNLARKVPVGENNQDSKGYLLLSQLSLTRDVLVDAVLSFLGSVGGLAHLLVERHSQQYVSWAYQCQVEIEITMLNENFKLNLARLLSRACWLAGNGKDRIKIYSCEYLHAVLVYSIGLVTNNQTASKENTAKLLDHILPTVINVSCNTAHPSQQLLHSLLIQTIHFLANSKQHNSPDVQVLLKHLLSLYSGADDMAYLASKCLYQFAKWHINQQLGHSDYPIIKSLLRNLWSHSANRKAREGILHLLLKLLKLVHRNERIMSLYGFQLGGLILNLSRCHVQLDTTYEYLCNKYTQSLRNHLKHLVPKMERSYNRYHTLPEFLDWLYTHGFFSLYAQQRSACFLMWWNILSHCTQDLHDSPLAFLKQRALRRSDNSACLFPSTSAVVFDLDEQSLPTCLSKAAALTEIWDRLIKNQIFESKIVTNFVDFTECCITSVGNLFSFLIQVFSQQPSAKRVLNDDEQVLLVHCLESFLLLCCRLYPARQALMSILHSTLSLKDVTINEVEMFLFSFVSLPTQLVPNLNVELINRANLFRLVIDFLARSNIGNSIATILEHVKRVFNIDPADIMNKLFTDAVLAETTVKIVLRTLVEADWHDRKVAEEALLKYTMNSQLAKHVAYVAHLLFAELILPQRLQNALFFLLSFPDSVSTVETANNCFRNRRSFLNRYDRQLNSFIASNWNTLGESIMATSTQFQQGVKLLLPVYQQLTAANKCLFSQFILKYYRDVSKHPLRDQLVLNFFSLQTICEEDVNTAELVLYVSYISALLRQGLSAENKFQTHEQSLNLAGLGSKILKQDSLLETVRFRFTDLCNLYLPLSLSKLPRKDQSASLSFLGAVISFVKMSGEFKFIRAFFGTFKDKDLEGELLLARDNLLQEAISSFATLPEQKQRQELAWLLGHYWDDTIDTNEWENYRFLIVWLFIKPVIAITNLQVVIDIFRQQCEKLLQVLSKASETLIVRDILLLLQVKNGALVLLQSLYERVPRPQKDKSIERIHKAELHKHFIKLCSMAVQSGLGLGLMECLQGQDEPNKTKALQVVKDYCCHSYNLLIVLFMKTQGSFPQYRKFLFETQPHSRIIFWEHLVDSSTTYHFEIETDFKTTEIVKPAKPIKTVSERIASRYLCNSLHVIDEANEQEDKAEDIPAQSDILPGSQQCLEMDPVNRHLCMQLILRVIDFVTDNFEESRDMAWAKQINEVLFDCKLGVRILLTKLILNRPKLFVQQCWGKHLLTYLIQENTGGQGLHYFFRDAVKLLIGFMTRVADRFVPELSQLNRLIAYVVKNLAHDNTHIYTDNIVILEQLLKVEGACVEKGLLITMLKSGGVRDFVKVEDEIGVQHDIIEKGEKIERTKSKFVDRLAAVLVLKACCLLRVPVLAQEEYLEAYSAPNQFQFLFDLHRLGLLAPITELIKEAKKHRIAAAGFLGEYLAFIFWSEQTHKLKEETFRLIAKFISSLIEKESNRAARQRFTTTLYFVVQHFPSILGDDCLYESANSGLVQFTHEERDQIIRALTKYCANAKQFADCGKVINIFMTLRANVKKVLSDSEEVQGSLLELLYVCSDHLLLSNKQVFESYFHIFGQVAECSARTRQEALSLQFYQMTIKLYHFLSPSEHFLALPFRSKVKKAMVRGLGCQFEQIRNMLLAEFEVAIKEEKETVERLMDIFEMVYEQDLEALWLLNVVPLMLSLVKNSSDFHRALFQSRLQEKALFYDWDFRNFSLPSGSQPYTVKRESLQGEDQLRGMLRATQNSNYLSQQLQVFTMLASQSDSSLPASQLSSLSYQPAADMSGEQCDQKYNKINQIFVSRRRRNQMMDSFKQSIGSKLSSGVQVVAEKVRFRKHYEKQRARFNKPIGPAVQHKGALLRKYKVGELPDICISLQDLLMPMIYLARYDHEFAGELFQQVFTQISMTLNRNSDTLRGRLAHMLMSSKQHQYNFVATLQKALIDLVQTSNRSFEISLKEVSLASNTLDYSILFAEQNLIRLLKQPSGKPTDFMRIPGQRDQSRDRQWCDLLDLYQHINQEDMIFGVMLQIAEGDELRRLKEAFECKSEGAISSCRKILKQIEKQDNVNKYFQEFLLKEKIDCAVLLSEWEQIKSDLGDKLLNNVSITAEESKMLLIAIQNGDGVPTPLLDKINFAKDTRFEYEQSIVSLLSVRGVTDKAQFHAKAAKKAFEIDWSKTSSFAFNSKHELLQTVQKTHELQQFLQLYGQRNNEGAEQQCFSLFKQWANRSPNQVHDGNLTWVQILSSRMMFGKLLQAEYGWDSGRLAKYAMKWHVQVINGMLERGIIGYAENMTRRAIQQRKASSEFSWDFYQALSRLRLHQLLRKNSQKLSDYEIITSLINREMNTYSRLGSYDRAQFMSIQNECLQGFIRSCVSRFQVDMADPIIDKIDVVFKNYYLIRKNLHEGQSTEDTGQKGRKHFEQEVHFRFAMFLEQMISYVKGKFEIPAIKQRIGNNQRDGTNTERMVNAERLVNAFVEELVLSIKLLSLSQSSSGRSNDSQKMFGLILKLLKVVQNEHQHVGGEFEEAVNDPNVPKWIFLYFLPQIIRTLNSFDLVRSFKGLFEIILANYPEALVYVFNCTYPSRTDCLTPQCSAIFDRLHDKVKLNFEFIDNLTLLQHPQLRLRDILQRFGVPGEAAGALVELQDLMANTKYIGRYNRKFQNDWSQRIGQFLSLQRATNARSQFEVHLRSCLQKLDLSKPQLNLSMKQFLKLSDGSTFFEQYNSSDWSRIEVPGTSYCRFEEPRPWKRVNIQSFDHQLHTLGSIRRPKRIVVLGSNEKQYMLLVKGGQDVRLDQRIEELFELVNRIFSNCCQCSRRQVQIRRFEVVPMKRMLGVFEWVDESQTLRQFLEVEYKAKQGRLGGNLTDKNQGFINYMNYIRRICPGVNDRNSWYKTLLCKPKKQIVENMLSCQNGIPFGLLRFGLQRLATNFDSFLHIKNTFVANYAASCIVTYVLGIGDRHLDNFLIHSSSASLVMIDFGYSFGSSVDLSIPELIPFRLTKSFRELTEPIGYDGAFKRSMASCYEALSAQMPLIVDYCDVFIDDPLLQWVWTSRKQLGLQSHSASNQFSATQEPPDKKMFSKKIENVRKKLTGANPRKLLSGALYDSKHRFASFYSSLQEAIWDECGNKKDQLSTNQLIDELILLASDPNITGRAYVGLNLYI